MVVDVYGDGSSYAGNIAAYHEHYSKLAERVRETQNCRGNDAGNGKRQKDLAEYAPATGAENRGGIEKP